ncbi:Centrosomal protein of 131 kDa [Clonorchis sinensis]|uniref:Centrosomal protein of 131 kDa n=1 Tax=Clonorchis sinensis TaxID=79923 RepID=A0A8T1MAP1_CLOSI|nr:Centrosomal protein of 131 kDa [Clonorchis sinensis]
MLDLSLRGSQICLSKLSNTSGRNSARSTEKSITGKSKVTGNGSLKTRMSSAKQNPDLDPSKFKAESSKRISGQEHPSNAKLSPEAVERSRRNVTDWLNTYVDDSEPSWEKLEMDSVHSGSQKYPLPATHRKAKCDPELKISLDSLDDSFNKKKKHSSLKSPRRVQFGRKASETRSDTSEVSLGPPPNYEVSQQSNNPQPNQDTNKAHQDEGYRHRTEAARKIQKFWRRYRRRQLAAQAALRRILEEQKLRMRTISPCQSGELLQTKNRNNYRSGQPKQLHGDQPIGEDNFGESGYHNVTTGDSPSTPRVMEQDGDLDIQQKRRTTPKSADNSEKSLPMFGDETPSCGNAADDVKIEGMTLRTDSEDECPDKLVVQTMLDDLASEIKSDNGNEFQGGDPSFWAEIDETSEPKSPSKGWSDMLNEINRVLSETDVDTDAKTLCFEQPLRDRAPSVVTEPIDVQPMEGSAGTYGRTGRIRGVSVASLPTSFLRNPAENRETPGKQQSRTAIGKTLERSVKQTRALLRTKNQTGSEKNNTISRETTGPPVDPWCTYSEAPELERKFPKFSSTATIKQNKRSSLEHSGNTATSVNSTWSGNTLEVESCSGPTVQSLIMQLEERTQSVQRLQRVLEHQRELSMRQLRDTQREAEQRKESMKADYEATLSRNYKLIDELIEEKKALHVKCENLMSEVKTVSQRLEEKLKVVQDRHKVDLRKAEAKAAAAEKLRREKWEAEKIKQLKETTARGLEAEIAQIVSKHQQEMQELRESCSEQVQSADSRAFQTYLQQLEELRRTLLREKEEACVREREAANQRLEKTLTDERTILEVHRNQLLKEMSDERERLTELVAKERETAQKMKFELDNLLKESVERHQHELEGQREQLTKQHQQLVEEMQKRHAVELEAAKEKVTRELEAKYSERESNLRTQLKQERDRQLETAVQRLEADMNMTKEEIQRDADSKIRRMKDKHAKELGELEQSEQQTVAKYSEMRNQVLELEHEIERYKLQLRQRDDELENVKSLYDKLTAERENLTEVVRQEFSDRIVASGESIHQKGYGRVEVTSGN